MYFYMHAYICKSVYVCKYVHTYICIDVYIHERIYTYTLNVIQQTFMNSCAKIVRIQKQMNTFPTTKLCNWVEVAMLTLALQKYTPTVF